MWNEDDAMEAVTFPNGPVTMAGDLHLPEGFDPGGSYAGLAVVHPGGGVKEQAARLYAAAMAGRGFVALAFDASHQGESGGEPRFLEDPAARVQDVRAAVDLLQGLDFVDAGRVGVLGVCAGGAYGVSAAMTDHRVGAVAAVSALNVGTTYRRGWFGTDPDSAAVATLEEVARQRTDEVTRGAEVATMPYVPVEPDENTPRDLVLASEYLMTDRGRHPHAPNRKLFAQSLWRMLAFDAFHLVEELLTQPLLIVAGSAAGSLWHSTELHGRARGPKRLVVVGGATHTDFYDVPEYVERAVSEAAPFFGEHLVARG